MGNYREQYEKYYGNMKKQGGAASYRRASSYDNTNFPQVNNKINLLEKVIRKFIWQLSGAAILFIIVAALRYIPVEGTGDELYIQAKDMINEDFDVNAAVMYFNLSEGESYKEKILDYIDEIKASVSGDKTLKEVVKEDYIEPVAGKIKYINGDSKGIAISSEGCEEVVSVYGGTVEEVRDDEDNKCVVINHGNGTETYYGSLSEVDVEAGSVITKGATIGKCGDIDATDKKGVIFKFIYLGNEKNPSDVMDLSSLEEV